MTANEESVMTASTKTLDHLVHLTPPGSVEETSAQFRHLGFTVIPGGTHAGGLTSNALVVFEDGVYLELISFTHPASYYPKGTPARKERDGHVWASKSPGWIDFAFLGNGSQTEKISDIINARAKKIGLPDLYLPEQNGGRQRPDGQVLKWVITPPVTRGPIPFFCGDMTPRGLRVPSDPPSNVVHRSTAKGVAYIRILTPTDSFGTNAQYLTSVIGNAPSSSEPARISWTLETPHHHQPPPQIILEIPQSVEEKSFVEEVGSGLFEVAFTVRNTPDSETSTPFGKISWIPNRCNQIPLNCSP